MRPTAFDRFCLYLGRACVLLALVVIPILVAEGMARLFHDPDPLRRVYDPFAYRIPQPNLVDEFVTRNGERVTVRLNEMGMRGPSVAEPLAADELTLVFLGGSTTENYVLPREETFPELIGERLYTATGRPIRVFNAGMSSASTSISLARLQHQVLDLQPSLVVVMHGINDLLFGFLPEFRADGRHLPRPAQLGRLPRSFLLDWLRRRRPLWSDARTEASGPRRQFTSYEGFLARRVFARNLRSMAAITSYRGIPILFLTQGTRYRREPAAGDEVRFTIASRVSARNTLPPDIPSLALGMEAFNAAVLAIPPSPGLHIFDLAARLPSSEEMMWDECHLTRAGNRRVATEVGPVVEAILR